MVRAKGGELHLVSWSKAHKGGVYTADQIVAAITNEGGEEEFAAGASPTSSGGKSLREKATMALMGLAIVGINTFTIWFLTKPPRSLVGDYRALPAERAERVITQVAGTYETGKKPGDRRLEIVTPEGEQRELRDDEHGSKRRNAPRHGSYCARRAPAPHPPHSRAQCWVMVRVSQFCTRR